MNCPRCGKLSRSTGKKWKYDGFDVEQYTCDSCAKIFNVFFKDGKISHTIPKAK